MSVIKVFEGLISPKKKKLWLKGFFIFDFVYFFLLGGLVSKNYKIFVFCFLGENELKIEFFWTKTQLQFFNRC